MKAAFSISLIGPKWQYFARYLLNLYTTFMNSHKQSYGLSVE